MPTSLRWFAWFILTAPVLSGCGDADGTAGAITPTVRDSAGVSLLEHPGVVLEKMPEWSIDTAAPLAVIGPQGPSGMDVSGVFSLTLLADGTTAGFHRRAATVVMFDPSGRKIAEHAAGDSTVAPFGLFVALADVRGDSVVASDITNARLAILSPSAGVVRWIPAVLGDGRDFYGAAGRLADGSWLLRPGYVLVGAPVPAAGALPEARAPIPIGRVGADLPAERFDTLMLVPGLEIVRAPVPVNGVVEYVDLAPTLGARSHAVRWGDEAAVITNADWSVQRFDATGALRSVIRIDAPRVAATDSLRTALIPGFRAATARRWVGDVDSVRRVSEVDSIVAVMPLPPFVAPYERMHLAPGRRLWVQETRLTPSDPARLIGFEPDGSIVGRLVVPLPEGGEVSAMGDDRVVVRVTVPDGRSYFVTYRIGPATR